MSDHVRDQFFLGPKAEQRRMLKELLELVVDDHAFWRRNFHPKDPPSISYRSTQDQDGERFRARLHQELFHLVADLKLDVPFFSPRYMAHMVSEVAVPGLVAYLATMLYNPNNVSAEASPVTVRHELEVGRQFAELVGFDPSRSFGHLCSGGTIANYESLWYNRAGRFLPVTIGAVCRRGLLERPSALPRELRELSNCSIDRAEALFRDVLALNEPRGCATRDILRTHSIGYLGEVGFRELVHEVFDADLRPAAVLVPRTAHYSWTRALSLLGLGQANLVPVEVDAAFRMDPGDFELKLEACRVAGRPIIQSVCVLGTTEFGSVDPVDELVAVRDAARRKGQESAIHVDAAYGGYFATMFRGDREVLEADRRAHAWLGPIAAAVGALKDVDSVTIDPHKMGYVPYGAGCIVIRNAFLCELVAEGAAYALESGMPHQDLGRFILEGSKPGAVAAATWFNHRMMPLDRSGYGGLVLDLCRLAHDLDRELTLAGGELEAAAAPFRFIRVNAPQTNIVCLLVIPSGAARLSHVDELNRRLAARFGVREVESVQAYDFLVSKTRLARDLPFVAGHPALGALAPDVPSVTALRLVLMNRWVGGSTHGGEPYLKAFLAALARACHAEFDSCRDEGSLTPQAPVLESVVNSHVVISP